MCAMSLRNHLGTAGDTCHLFISATEHVRGEVQKSEVLQIGSTLLVVKAKNIYFNTPKR